LPRIILTRTLAVCAPLSLLADSITVSSGAALANSAVKVKFSGVNGRLEAARRVSGPIPD